MEVFGFFTKVANILYLSILWFITSIPIVTIGASTTAYCYVLDKIIWDKEGYVTKNFFKAFKNNFKSSTKVWLILILPILLFSNNFAYMWKMACEQGGMYTFMLPTYGVLLLLLWGVLIYVFPYMAKFDNTALNTIKNSFLMSGRHMGFTIIMMIIDFIVLFIGFGVFLPVALIAPAAIGFVNVGLLDFVFRKYIE